jgi:c-di-AMP phosphodiesterase-like protein
MKSYFDNSMVFDDWKSAHVYAQRMDDKLMTEHGILVVRHKQDWTWDEVYMNKKFKQKRKLKEKEELRQQRINNTLHDNISNTNENTGQRSVEVGQR